VEFLFVFGFVARCAGFGLVRRSDDRNWERILSEVCVDGFSLVLLHAVLLKSGQLSSISLQVDTYVDAMRSIQDKA
jgi:hypothetical protein